MREVRFSIGVLSVIISKFEIYPGDGMRLTWDRFNTNN
jgi:hypothetical protein